jgi:hypothetical protein
MAPLNYAAQYGRELANAYPYLSHYGDLWNAGESQRFKPLQGKTVYIPHMTTSGATAVDRDNLTGVFARNFDIDWEPHALEMDREWSTLIDPMDIVETNEVATIANVTRTFNEFQKVPEMDAYMCQKLTGFATAASQVDTTTLTTANILEKWDSAIQAMVDARVNRDRIRCKMTPATYSLLKEAAGVTRFVEVSAGIQGLDRNVAKLDGVQIEVVPSDLMKSAYVFTTGWVADASAVQVNMVLYDPMCIAAPIVYETSMISAPTAQSKGKYLYYERYYYDVFQLSQRAKGVYAFTA